MVVVHEYSVLSTQFNTCLPYFKVESKITHDFMAQCSMFTYKLYRMNVNIELYVNKITIELYVNKITIELYVNK